MKPDTIDRVGVKELLNSIQADLPALEELLAQCSEGWGYEDSIYRFYHQSFKASLSEVDSFKRCIYN